MCRRPTNDYFGVSSTRCDATSFPSSMTSKMSCRMWSPMRSAAVLRNFVVSSLRIYVAADAFVEH